MKYSIAKKRIPKDKINRIVELYENDSNFIYFSHEDLKDLKPRLGTEFLQLNSKLHAHFEEMRADDFGFNFQIALGEGDCFELSIPFMTGYKILKLSHESDVIGFNNRGMFLVETEDDEEFIDMKKYANKRMPIGEQLALLYGYAIRQPYKILRSAKIADQQKSIRKPQKAA